MCVCFWRQQSDFHKASVKRGCGRIGRTRGIAPKPLVLLLLLLLLLLVLLLLQNVPFHRVGYFLLFGSSPLRHIMIGLFQELSRNVGFVLAAAAAATLAWCLFAKGSKPPKGLVVGIGWFGNNGKGGWWVCFSRLGTVTSTSLDCCSVGIDRFVVAFVIVVSLLLLLLLLWIIIVVVILLQESALQERTSSSATTQSLVTTTMTSS